MKKQKITILVLTMTLCASAAFSGCAAGTTKPADKTESATTDSMSMEEAKDSSSVLSSNGTSSAQARKSDEVLSAKEQSKEEETRRAEIAEQYSIYAPYGMTYDIEKDRFLYDGQVVRYFKDQINSDEINAFFFDDGVVDVEPIRDTTGTLAGLKKCSDAEFKARTEKQEELNTELKKAGITGESGSFEQGEPNYQDDSLNAYIVFGVSYDNTSEHWMYSENPIYILYDADHYTFCDKSVSDGISLKVVRDKDNNIEKLVSVDKKELEQFVQ